MAKRSYTEEERQTALKLYESDGPSAVTEQLGIPKQTVAHWAKQSGIRTVRTQKTHEASEAISADNKVLRATIASKTLSAADKASDLILKKLESIEKMDADEGMKDLATVLGILVDKHGALVKMDQSNENHSAVDSWLEHITGLPNE